MRAQATGWTGKHQRGGRRAETVSLVCRDLFSESLRALPAVLAKGTWKEVQSLSEVRRKAKEAWKIQWSVE